MSQIVVIAITPVLIYPLAESRSLNDRLSLAFFLAEVFVITLSAYLYYRYCDGSLRKFGITSNLLLLIIVLITGLTKTR